MRLLFLLLLISAQSFGQTDKYTLLKPARVFDGVEMHDNWIVLVKNDTIVAAGPQQFKLPAGTTIIELPGKTLMPGLIEGHSHLLLHPYNETKWEDQVLKESRAERMLRAGNHAKATVLAGFTMVRDLGTEGAEYDDVGLKKAIEKGLIIGPRMQVVTKAIVARGTYAPRPASSDIDFHQGAAEVGNVGEMQSEVRLQISKGADLIKLYADYRWGKSHEAMPTFTVEEMKAAVEIAQSGGRQVVAHATSVEGMKRAIAAGVYTIEHGDQGTLEVFKLMKEKGIAYCPTLAASDAYEQYGGWNKASGIIPASIQQKKKSFQAALAAGVTIVMGGDVGVFTQGDNAREMIMMVEYGMTPIDVLKSATSVNATVFGVADKLGFIKPGLLADLIAVDGDPSKNIGAVKAVGFVMLGGKVIKN
ncbi:MAG: amidohydrolase family protein [Chitinophagaceae bacterium]|nr:amidohydrolase family protein [Chitinophagaceae bacterium]